MQEIEAVCAQARIHDFIRGLPDGDNTVIGEGGLKLSGGQWQRLAIARILLYNPDVILFDEASSSLDGENEQGVMEALRGIARHNPAQAAREA